MKQLKPLLLTAFFLFAFSGFAQQTTTNTGNDQSKKEKKEAKAKKKEAKEEKKKQKIAEGKSLISPLDLPAYTPELGFLISAAGLWSFKPTDKKDMSIQRSSLPVMIGFSSTGAIVGNAILTSFWLHDKLRVYGQFWYKDMPDNYWGSGKRLQQKTKHLASRRYSAVILIKPNGNHTQLRQMAIK